MNDEDGETFLNSLEIDELISGQRQWGRLSLPSRFRQHWAKQHRLAGELLAGVSRSSHAARMARLLRTATNYIANVAEGEKPNYCQYLDTPILDWYLEGDRFEPALLKSACLAGIRSLLIDLDEFETRSAAGLECYQRLEFDERVVPSRSQAIANALNVLREAFGIVAGQERTRCNTLGQYALESSRDSVLLDLSCAPLTESHDEVAFIRILQASELCFLAILVCLRTTVRAMKQDTTRTAIEELNQAAAIAQLLHKLLLVLRTMPVRHFASFRDATGSASAIQSKIYHLMEIYLKGVSQSKMHLLMRSAHMRSLLRFDHPKFVSLRVALSRCSAPSEERQELFESAQRLDRNLLTWRGLHWSFARLYIPNGGPGTGGTPGADYLRRYLADGIFPEAEPDWTVIRHAVPETGDPSEEGRKTTASS